MKRQDFNNLINYLKNRPEEVQRLREVLGAEPPKPATVWLSATDAGKEIGKSGSWIRQHIDLWPSAKRVQRGSRFAWMLKREEMRTQYNIWLFNNNK